jgi:hypothetical protein
MFKVVWTAVLLALLAVSSAIAQTKSKVPQTKSITIGNFEYLGSAIQTKSDGTTGVVSSYELNLDATGITVDPITFGNVIFVVKGSSLSSKQGGFPIITTGAGCGEPNVTASCSLLAQGGENGFLLQPCARIAPNQTLIQNCISVALQLVSMTGKNFSFQLVDGETFCTSGIANTFVLADEDQVALDPGCDMNNFCKGASVPVVLRALPIQNCS